MKTLGDYLDKITDIFRNTRTSDMVMYIVSAAAALFRGHKK